MKLKSGVYFLIAIILVMLAVIVNSLQMKDFASKLLPLVFGGLVLLLAVLQLLRETKGKVKAKRVSDDDIAMDEARERWQGYLIHGGWVTGFALAIYLVGFLIAIPLFTLSYARWQGTRWVPAILLAVVVSGILYGLFERVLGIVLYRGLFLGMLGF